MKTYIVFSYRYTHIHQTDEFIAFFFTILPPVRSLLKSVKPRQEKKMMDAEQMPIVGKEDEGL